MSQPDHSERPRLRGFGVDVVGIAFEKVSRSDDLDVSALDDALMNVITVSRGLAVSRRIKLFYRE